MLSAKRTPASLLLGPALLLVLPYLTSPTSAQSTIDSDGCLRLSGSVVCPGFSAAYLSPGNLTNAFPFFSTVTDVDSFDAAALDYFTNAYEWPTTKFIDQLDCTNASSAVIRYQRTVQCSKWVNEQWSVACFDKYNTSQIATGPKMVCQDTCTAYSASEAALVLDQTYCPGTANTTTNATRESTILADYTSCTDWATLTTANTTTCVAGDSNEGNCGFGTGTNQLCSFCSGTTPNACCYMSTTDLTSCDYTLAAATSTSSSSAVGSSSTGGSAASSRNLSGGAIAGIVVGSVVGALLLLLLLLLLLVFCGCCAIGAFGRKRKEKRQSRGSSFAAAGATPRIGAHNEPYSPDPSNQPPMSERSGLFTSGPASSRTMVPETASFAGSSDKLMKASAAGAAGGFALGPAAPVPGFNAAAPGRTLLSSVRDENQSGEHLILPNSPVTVLWPYTAALPDELSLRPGMKLQVLRIYDDAWGTGQIVDGEAGEKGKQGAFPLVCVTENNAESSDGSPQGTGDGDSLRWSGSHEQ